jgi:hypothetical protein
MTMGCDCTFTATAGVGQADPSRHVNYVTGMVLGVDDYAQEFAYHSARHKRIVRDFLGYGTLSGLAVGLEDGGDGPRVMVSAGSAAAPSGQLICVGRDQCGEINAWLKRPEVRAQLDARADAANTLDLTLHLTLCYTDCAVDAVPIPGEPCRSEENLMAPSRRADDYCLSFAFDAPLQTEARALAVVEAWVAAAEAALDAGGVADEAQFKPLLAKAQVQILSALGVRSGAITPTDLAPVVLAPAAFPAFVLATRKTWITVLRPQVMAQSCGSPDVPANDCVLLGSLVFEATRGIVPDWSAPAIANIALDERERPFMLSAMAMQSTLALRLAPPSTTLALAYYTDDSPDFAPAWPVSVIVAANAADMTLTLPIGGAEQAKGDTVTLVHGTARPLTLTNAKRDAADPAVLDKRGRYRLVYNGTDAWRVFAVAEEEG